MEFFHYSHQASNYVPLTENLLSVKSYEMLRSLQKKKRKKYRTVHRFLEKYCASNIHFA